MSLTTNLISYWKLNEASGNALDAHGSNTLTDNNSIGTSIGRINSARTFVAASSQHFSIATNSDVETGDIDFTFTAWIKLTSTGSYQTVLGKGLDAEYYFGISNTNIVYFMIGNSVVSSATTFGALTTGVWYFVVGWHDASADTINVSVNGVVDSAGTSGSSPAAGSQDFHIGSRRLVDPLYFNGVIDEVGFWKRVLTSQERTDLYNSGLGLPYPFYPITTDLISYWKLNEVSGNALDSHGSNDLTDINTVGTGTGKINSARDFERDNAESFSHADSVDLSVGDNDATWTAWVKLETKPASNLVVFQKLTVSDGEYFLYYDGAADRFKWEVYGSSGFGSGHILTANTLGSVSTGTWYFLVAWHDAANNQIGLTINNIAETPVSHSTGFYDSTGDFQIGGGTFGGSWDGLIDEAGFWKRVLTSQEMTDLYNGGSGLSYPFSSIANNLISYWKMDEASGDALDSHGSITLTETTGSGIDSAAGKINTARDFETGEFESFNKTGFSLGDQDFTFTCWVNAESLVDGAAIISKWETPTDRSFVLFFESNRFQASFNYDGLFTTHTAIANNFGTPSISTWYFIVFSYDTTADEGSISVNAGTPDTVSHPNGVYDSAAVFKIGQWDFGRWDGLIDEVGYWQRVLTSQERTYLYNGGAGLEYPFLESSPESPPEETTAAMGMFFLF